jgi:hypothetical protein
MTAAQPDTNPRWFTTAAGLEHDEDRDQPGVICHVRPDLEGCLTAEVSQTSDGRWKARLFSGPDSYTEVIRAHRIVAERLASEHSDRLTLESFFADRGGTVTPRATSSDAKRGELASDLKALGINQRDLQVRIETAADLETLPLTDGRLQEIEDLRAAVAALEDIITRARNRAVAQAVASRWTYQRIRRATGLSISRIGQIAPARAGRDPEAEPTTPKPKARRQRK